MGTFTIRHTFDLDEETFWNRCFLDTEFNRKLYVERLGFTGYEVLEEKKEEGGKMRRKVRATPKAEAPAAIKKLIGGDIASRTAPGLVPRDLGVLLLAPGVFGVAFALNVVNSIGDRASFVLSAVVACTIGSDLVAQLFAPRRVIP